MLKITGVLLLVISSYGCGVLLSKRVLKRLNELNMSITLLKYIQIEINSAALSLQEIIYKMCRKDEFDKLDFIKSVKQLIDNNENFRSSWKNSLEKYKQNTSLTKDDLEILESLGDVLGASDSSSQSKAIDDKLRILDIAYEQAKDDVSKKCKLYKTLGLLCGVSAAIFLI